MLGEKTMSVLKSFGFAIEASDSGHYYSRVYGISTWEFNDDIVIHRLLCNKAPKMDGIRLRMHSELQSIFYKIKESWFRCRYQKRAFDKKTRVETRCQRRSKFLPRTGSLR